MAKVRKATSTPKKGDQTKKGSEKETTTTTKIKACPKSKKPIVQNDENDGTDSGISSPEKTKRTSKLNKSSSTISKLSKKSKSTISKASTSNKSKSLKTNAKTMEVSWLKGLIQIGSTVASKKKKIKFKGMTVNGPETLHLERRSGIEYATFPSTDGLVGGYVKMSPNSQKEQKTTRAKINFIVLMGTLDLITSKQTTKYSPSGSMTIPKGVKYGLKNTSNEICFLRFQTMVDD